MKKLTPWFLVVMILFTSVACRIGFNPGQSGESSPTAVVIENKPIQIPTVQPISSIPGYSPEVEARLIELYPALSAGVVAIQTISQAGGGLGSGFVYDTEGHIITNYHVIEGADDLEVDFPSGFKAHARVIGTDLDSDIAVIEVDAPAEVLHPLPLGDSDQLQVGQSVIAIGNPFGLTGTMTLGILSAKGRTLDSMRQTSDGQFYSAGDLLQTDASINPGNSGGPLMNLNGEVIGINRAIRTTSVNPTGDPVNSGIGFAISINIVKRVVPELIAKGSYDYPYLGISARPELSLLEQEALGLSQATGAYVVEVTPGSPADEAGLIAGARDTNVAGVFSGGDLIVAIDGRPVQVFGDLLSYLMVNKNPGDDVVLTILRDNEQKEVTLTLGKRP